MKFETFLALRYFRAKRRTGFISIITYVSVIGVIIGVAALDIVLSAYNGFESEVRSRLISADAHIHLRKFYENKIENYQSLVDTVRTAPGVAGASPVIVKESVLVYKGTNIPVALRGVDPATIGDVSIITESIVSGEFDLGKHVIDGKEYYGIVLGRYLAEQLYIFEPGEIVTLFAVPEQFSLTPRARAKQFVVTGLSELGFYEYDKILAFVALEAAQDLFSMQGAVTRIDVKLNNYAEASEIAPKLEERLGGYPFLARTWFDQNKSLYSWMEYEKWLFTIILSLIIMVAAFNIVSSLVMIVMEKTREIGILKSMGASAKQIMRIFLSEGIIIGVLGTIGGTVLAFAVCWAQQTFGFVTLPPDVYIIDQLPVQMKLFDFAIVATIAMTLCLLAATYPAYKASRLSPVDAIRYE
jgi:lipoprotein-releasing system permease protein